MIAALDVRTFMRNYTLQLIAIYMERDIDAWRKQAENKR